MVQGGEIWVVAVVGEVSAVGAGKVVVVVVVVEAAPVVGEDAAPNHGVKVTTIEAVEEIADLTIMTRETFLGTCHRTVIHLH